MTVYREGTRQGVMISNEEHTTSNRNGDIIIKTHAPKRPKKLSCDIHHVTAKGQEWIVLIGMMNGSNNPMVPYEVFALKKKNIDISPKIQTGSLVRTKSGSYRLETEFVNFDNLTELFEQDEEEALTRQISLNLRHGTPVDFIVEQLNKSEGTIVSFSKAIARSLKKYIDENVEIKEACPICGGKLIYVEGCVQCENGDYSKCG